MPQRSIFCIALSRGRAGRLVLDLKEAEFACTDISALFLDQTAYANGASAKENAEPAEASSERVTQLADVAYGVMAWIASVGCCVVQRGDPIIAVGPISAALTDATGDGAANCLIDLGIPQPEAARYEGRIKSGHILISVHAKDAAESDRARAIFAAGGAQDIYTMEDAFASKASAKNGHSMRGGAVA